MNEPENQTPTGPEEPAVIQQEAVAQIDLPPPAAPQPIAFEFRGKAGEYFKIWVVNLALTLLTLGIYSPWAKVRKLRYFYGNTYLDGSSFEFLGSPIAILKGRIIAVLAFSAYWLAANFNPFAYLLLLPVFALCFPWVMARALIFRARNSAYRNLTFSYHGSYRQIAVAYLSLPLLMAGLFAAMFYMTGVSPLIPQAQPHKVDPQIAGGMGLMLFAFSAIAFFSYPYFFYLQKRVFVAPRKFGDAPFTFDTGPKAFYSLMMKMIGIAMIVMTAVMSGVGMMAAGMKGMLQNAGAGHGAAAMPMAITLVMGLIELLLFIVFITWTRNLILSALRVGDAKLNSELKVKDVFLIYLTNIIAIVCTLGLLTPWAKVRLTRYQMSKTSLSAPQGTEAFTGTPSRSNNAVGEELADVFDMDLGI